MSQLVEDTRALEAAEQVSRGLRRGEHEWACPGCSVRWRGVPNGQEHLAHKAHMKRHPTHARAAG